MAERLWLGGDTPGLRHRQAQGTDRRPGRAPSPGWPVGFGR